MELTKQTILDQTNRGLQVFEHFLRNYWEGLNKSFRNPFYQDTKPSCRVYLNEEKDQYYFKDFGDAEFHLDCFGLVARLYNLSIQGRDFITVLELINDALNLGLSSNSDSTTKGLPVKPVLMAPVSNKPKTEVVEDSVFILPVYQVFSNEEREYWGQFGIELDVLNRYGVQSVAKFSGTSKTGNEYEIVSSPEEPMFAYPGQGFVKYYRPHSKLRFMYQGKKSGTYCFGLSQLPKKGDVLFITGGEKDVLSLSAHQFNAICFNSETANISRRILKRLRFRFKHIVLLFDNDPTGLKSMDTQVAHLKEFSVKKLILPAFNGKDISDFFALGKTREDLLALFIELLEREYEETMAMMASCEVQFDHPPETPEPIIKIKETIIGSVGNLLAVTGAEGSGKSNFLGAVLAGSIGNKEEEIDTVGTDILENTTEKAVLVYDTEQSEDQLYRNVHQVMRRSKRQKPPHWLKVYGLVSIDRKDRMLSILQSMDQFYYKYGGIHLVIIDGIADLIESVNDEEKAVALIDELFRLAAIYNTCIICVLHLSPSGYKLRGHLGSEVQRKAAGIVSIEKDEGKDVSFIKALKVRDGSPLDVPQIRMVWNKSLKYHTYDGENDLSSRQERKKEDLKEIAISIFEEKNERTYKELVRELCVRLGVKERMGKNYLQELHKHKIIRLNEDNGSAKYVLNV